MTITIEELRRKYPDPVKGKPGELLPRDKYCVGGALLREMGCRAYEGTGPLVGSWAKNGRSTAKVQDVAPSLDAVGEPIEVGPFPDSALLAEMLMRVNRHLTGEAAVTFAETIIRKNDTGNFETAWGLLGDALAWTDEEWTEADTFAMREFARGGNP